MAKEKKTNVMRLLDQHQIDYQSYHWYCPEDMRQLTEASIYKTLVTVGKSGAHYVFVIPVDQELDLKKAAQAVGEKNIHMIKEKDLLPLTGYVHGGCSPIGMHKELVTVIDDSARDQSTIIFSAGKVGVSVEVDPNALASVLRFSYQDVATEEI